MIIACLLAVILCVALFVVIGGLALFYLSKQSILWGFIPEGQIVVIMEGGKVKEYLSRINGFWTNPHTGENFEVAKMTPAQIREREKTEDEKSLISKFLESYLGLHWIGIWPYCRRYEYRFKWSKWSRKEKSSEYELIPRDEVVNSLYFKFTYPIRMEGLETKGKVPLDVTILINTRITNAERALFKTSDWLASVTGAVTAVVRDFIGAKELEEISGESHENNSNGFFRDIMILNDPNIGNPSLNKMFGIVIDAVNFIGYEISGEDNARLQKASTEKYVAAQEAEAKAIRAKGNAEATVTEATGKATAIEKLAEAKAKATKLQGEADADAAEREKKAKGVNADVAMADAIKNTGVTTLILGQGIIPTLPLKDEKREEKHEP